MPRKVKEFSSNGHDLSALAPYRDRHRRLEQDVSDAQQALKDLYAEMKGQGHPKEIIDDFKSVMKADKFGIEIKKSKDDRFWNMARAIGIVDEVVSGY